MKAIDLTKLIEGLLVVILAAMALGKYDALRTFAAHEAAASLRGWDTHAFFPVTYRQIAGITPGNRVHRKGMEGDRHSPSHLVQPDFK